MIEHVFIIQKTLELEKGKEAISWKYHYEPRYLLLCHIPMKDRIHPKRRRNFNTLATFVNYEYGNVLVQIYNINQKIVLLIYCTKFLCKSIEYLNMDENSTFLRP
jgi:hypothetical protein